MKRLRDLLIDGLLLALPIAIVLLLASQVFDKLRAGLRPVSAHLPNASLLGIVAVDVLAILVMLLCVVALGAFANMAIGRAMGHTMERVVLRKVPGFLFFKSIASGFSSEERDSGLKPALIAFDDNTVVGFIVEDATGSDDKLTVFVPGAPTATSGNIVLVERSRVTLLDVSLNTAMRAVGQLGLGVQALSRKMPASISAGRGK